MARLSEQELELIQQARDSKQHGPATAPLARAAGVNALVDFVTQYIVQPAKLAMRRRETIAQLQGLDDRLLADIGLERGMLDQVADAVVADEAGARAKPAGPLAALRRWYQRQATIRELRALDDRMLADIGIERDDIVATVERQTQSKTVLAAVPSTVEDLITQARIRTDTDRTRAGANSNTPWDHKLAVGQPIPAWWQA